MLLITWFDYNHTILDLACISVHALYTLEET